MEVFSNIVEKAKLSVEIKTDSYLMDHAFLGQAVLPAVEAMETLAVSTKAHLPHADVSLITDARFDRFLLTAPADRRRWIEIFNDVEVCGDGRIRSRLATRMRSSRVSIKRVMEHVAVQFGGERNTPVPIPLDVVFALQGICMEISPHRLYRDLVPFGPTYHNAIAHLFLSKYGAVGNLKAGVNKDLPSGRLGSPFPLDAAFHLASAWVQRYGGFVGFPVGFDRRIIYSPTRPGKDYVCRIKPVERDAHAAPCFDIWIYDQNGDLKEELARLEMKDVSKGTLRPPPWILQGVETPELESLKTRCTALSLIELDTVHPLAEKALSDDETYRLHRMSPKRKISYLAARLCCKSLYRGLSGDLISPASSFTTVAPDGIRPWCRKIEGQGAVFCSVSHDSRFAVAVASNRPIGIDVEEVSERVCRSRDIYMNKEERDLVEGSALGEEAASVRIWSAKEAAAKAIGMSLAESWEKVSLKDVDRDRSILKIGSRSHEAFHDAIDDHVFTVVNMQAF